MIEPDLRSKAPHRHFPVDLRTSILPMVYKIGNYQKYLSRTLASHLYALANRRLHRIMQIEKKNIKASIYTDFEYFSFLFKVALSQIKTGCFSKDTDV